MATRSCRPGGSSRTHSQEQPFSRPWPISLWRCKTWPKKKNEMQASGSARKRSQEQKPQRGMTQRPKSNQKRNLQIGEERTSTPRTLRTATSLRSYEVQEQMPVGTSLLQVSEAEQTKNNEVQPEQVQAATLGQLLDGQATISEDHGAMCAGQGHSHTESEGQPEQAQVLLLGQLLDGHAMIERTTEDSEDTGSLWAGQGHA